MILTRWIREELRPCITRVSAVMWRSLSTWLRRARAFKLRIPRYFFTIDFKYDNLETRRKKKKKEKEKEKEYSCK
jgi:hypothetical protein